MRFKTPKQIHEEGTDFDLPALLASLRDTIACLAAEVGGRIKAIAIASVGEMGVLLDGKMRPIGPMIAWYDPRGKEIADGFYESGAAEMIYRETGLPAHSNYSACKILWIRSHLAAARAADMRWLHLPDYIAYTLTGKCMTEYSIASRSMLLDVKSAKWSDALLLRFGLSDLTFPEITVAGSPVGVVQKALADKLGLAESTTVTIAGHDHMAGSVAVDLAAENEILNSTGTTEGLLSLSSLPRLTDDAFNRRYSNGRYVDPELYTLFGALPAGGLTLEWLAKFFGSESGAPQNFLHEAAPSYEALALTAKDPLVCIPHLRGSGPPVRNPDARGLIYGLTEGTGRAEFTLGVLLGLCLELKQLAAFFEPAEKIVKVIGPAVKNPLWLQMKADALHCEIDAYEVDEAVAMGAALIAAKKQNLVPADFRLKLPVTRYLPRRRHAERLQSIYESCYKCAYRFKAALEKRKR